MNRMIPIQIITILQYLSSMIFFKKGSLTLITGVAATISLYTLKWETILEGTNFQRVLVPIIIQGFCMGMYAIAISVDLWTGISASKSKNNKRQNPVRNIVKSHRLYRTMWKFLAVTMLTSTICFFAVISEILDSIVYEVFLWTLIWLWFLAIAFEWQSIGENTERMDGYKSRIFTFIDRLLNRVEKKGIDRIGNMISNKDNDNQEDNINPSEEESLK